MPLEDDTAGIGSEADNQPSAPARPNRFKTEVTKGRIQAPQPLGVPQAPAGMRRAFDVDAIMAEGESYTFEELRIALARTMDVPPSGAAKPPSRIPTKKHVAPPLAKQNDNFMSPDAVTSDPERGEADWARTLVLEGGATPDEIGRAKIVMVKYLERNRVEADITQYQESVRANLLAYQEHFINLCGEAGEEAAQQMPVIAASALLYFSEFSTEVRGAVLSTAKDILEQAIVHYGFETLIQALQGYQQFMFEGQSFQVPTYEPANLEVNGTPRPQQDDLELRPVAANDEDVELPAPKFDIEFMSDEELVGGEEFMMNDDDWAALGLAPEIEVEEEKEEEFPDLFELVGLLDADKEEEETLLTIDDLVNGVNASEVSEEPDEAPDLVDLAKKLSTEQEEEIWVTSEMIKGEEVIVLEEGDYEIVAEGYLDHDLETLIETDLSQFELARFFGGLRVQAYGLHNEDRAGLEARFQARLDELLQDDMAQLTEDQIREMRALRNGLLEREGIEEFEMSCVHMLSQALREIEATGRDAQMEEYFSDKDLVDDLPREASEFEVGMSEVPEEYVELFKDGVWEMDNNDMADFRAKTLCVREYAKKVERLIAGDGEQFDYEKARGIFAARAYLQGVAEQEDGSDRGFLARTMSAAIYDAWRKWAVRLGRVDANRAKGLEFSFERMRVRLPEASAETPEEVSEEVENKVVSIMELMRRKKEFDARQTAEIVVPETLQVQAKQPAKEEADKFEASKRRLEQMRAEKAKKRSKRGVLGRAAAWFRGEEKANTIWRGYEKAA